MRRWKLAAGSAAASVALAAGMFAAFNLVAKAQVATCPGSGTPLTCTITDAIVTTPATMTLVITTDPGGAVIDVSYTTNCYETDGGTAYPSSLLSTQTTTSGSDTASGTADVDVEMDAAVISPVYCDVTANADLDPTNTVDVTSLTMELDYTPQAAATTASPTPSTTPSPTPSATTTTTYYDNQVHGFDGTCLDDKGNSKSERAEVIIWTCSNTDQAQGWTYSGDELKIHGLCVNAKGNGKSGSHLILWPCTGSANEIWVHNSKDEYVEKANGWSLCLDDPAYSTKNGTQLFVYKCNNGANQHWSKP